MSNNLLLTIIITEILMQLIIWLLVIFYGALWAFTIGVPLSLPAGALAGLWAAHKDGF